MILKHLCIRDVTVSMTLHDPLATFYKKIFHNSVSTWNSFEGRAASKKKRPRLNSHIVTFLKVGRET